MDFHGPDCPLPWQGSGGGPDVQIPRIMELRAAAAVCLLRGVWETGPSCDEEGDWGSGWAGAGGGAGAARGARVSVTSALYSPTARVHCGCPVLCPQEGDWEEREEG